MCACKSSFIEMGWREEFDFEIPCFSPCFSLLALIRTQFSTWKMIFGKSKVQEVILQTIRALSQAVISSFPVLLRLNIVIRWYIEFAFKARETFKIFYIKAHCRIFDSTGSHKPCNALHAWKLQKKTTTNKQTQIINHNSSIPVSLQLQKSQTDCTRTLNNNLSVITAVSLCFAVIVPLNDPDRHVWFAPS